ncbi:hypothetical protein NDK43_08450 [Neobacillus pocheonensis]|uniref:Integrase catalytic domain-containing protein n=1 Tax=Neobacillus pocheonensis TaxID=363869 RepID=A0ABT0W8T4_9BACI|nr:hypothetical protein [Neobacillus pocheonensis]
MFYKTLRRLDEAMQEGFHPEAILHSDQGFHYTHPLFQEKVKKLVQEEDKKLRGNINPQFILPKPSFPVNRVN